jgi:hypothetical protein
MDARESRRTRRTIAEYSWRRGSRARMGQSQLRLLVCDVYDVVGVTALVSIRAVTQSVFSVPLALSGFSAVLGKRQRFTKLFGRCFPRKQLMFNTAQGKCCLYTRMIRLHTRHIPIVHLTLPGYYGASRLVTTTLGQRRN